MSKLFYSDTHLRHWVSTIVRDMINDDWKPNYVVGITRGGLVPATMISHYFDPIKFRTLNVSLRDEPAMQHNEELPLLAAGVEWKNGYVETVTPQNILIVDDINDSGNTLTWIRDDWKATLDQAGFPEDSWKPHVRTAVLINNEASNYNDVDYYGTSIDRRETTAWCVFPWEHWWLT